MCSSTNTTINTQSDGQLRLSLPQHQPRPVRARNRSGADPAAASSTTSLTRLLGVLDTLLNATAVASRAKGKAHVTTPWIAAQPVTGSFATAARLILAPVAATAARSGVTTGWGGFFFAGSRGGRHDRRMSGT